MWTMFDGRLVREEEAVVSIFDHGFMYGVGLFETLRIQDGVPLFLARHLARLTQSCAEIGIQLHYDQSLARQQIATLLAANQWREAYLRISVSAGEAALGLPQQLYQYPHIILYMKSLAPLPPLANRPARALQLLQLRRNSPEARIRYKSFHYLNNILGKQEILQYEWAAAAEGLFLNEHGHVTEGIVSNLFFVKNQKIFTPAEQTGLLPGITRDVIMELAESLAIPYETGYYSFATLQTADEIFLTNSVQEIVAVDRLYTTDGMSSAFPCGPVTQRLSLAYEQLKRSLSHET